MAKIDDIYSNRPSVIGAKVVRGRLWRQAAEREDGRRNPKPTKHIPNAPISYAAYLKERFLIPAKSADGRLIPPEAFEKLGIKVLSTVPNNGYPLYTVKFPDNVQKSKRNGQCLFGIINTISNRLLLFITYRVNKQKIEIFTTL